MHHPDPMYKAFEILEEIRETCSEEFVNEKLTEELFKYMGGDDSLRALEWITRLWEIKISVDLSDYSVD
jgi:hypothetical protein